MSGSTVPPRPDDVNALLVETENACRRAADVLLATSRAVTGERLELYHDADVQTTFAAALAAVATDLKALGHRARCGRADLAG